MNIRQKVQCRRLAPIALLAAATALPYYLYTQGSPALMENIHLFLAAFLASVALAMWAWGMGRYVGLALMSLGVVMLVVLHIFGLTFSNRLLLIAITLVLLGVVVHVWAQKKESKY